MIREARSAEGMLLNTTLLNLWGLTGIKCDKNNCAAAFNLNTFTGSTSLKINCMTIGTSNTTSFILLGSSNGIIQILNMDGLLNGQLSLNNDCDITSLSFQASSGLLLSTCSDGKCQFWSFSQRRLLNDKIAHSSSLLCGCVSRSRPICIIGTDDGIIKEYDTGDYNLIRQYYNI